MRPIIQVRNLSKQYKIGGKKAAYGTLRDSIAGALRNPFRRNGSEENTIWALRDVSFDVMPGEVVGIIGRNGAGKSTLLKILSRITEPTTGEIDIYGRVGSLLEVGTGFHQELSGRENIYLNGAVLGMKRSEIDRKFDEIVDFAEVEKFIDTPVKHYSSGMYLRLAFAVAAHLEPEILIVDEVLAVGDTKFQQKCLGKIDDLSKNSGRTVLFVSHNSMVIKSLCEKAIYIKSGNLETIGDVNKTINMYLKDQNFTDHNPVNEYDQIIIIGTNITNSKKQQLANIDCSIEIKINIRVKKPFTGYIVFILRNAYDQIVFEFPTEMHEFNSHVREISFTLPENLLNSGVYFLQLNFNDDRMRIVHYQKNLAEIEIVEVYDRGIFYLPTGGDIKPRLNYSII